jgi:hypothetical protein
MHNTARMGKSYFYPCFSKKSFVLLVSKLVQKLLQKWTTWIEKEQLFSILVETRVYFPFFARNRRLKSEHMNGRSDLVKICFSTYFINFHTFTQIFKFSQQN